MNIKQAINGRLVKLNDTPCPNHPDIPLYKCCLCSSTLHDEYDMIIFHTKIMHPFEYSVVEHK